jgi:propionate CoA-transferase
MVIEIAPGIDLQRDVLDQSEINLKVSPFLREMNPAIFTDAIMNLQLKAGKLI